MKVHAEVRPLTSKHYGTEILVTLGNRDYSFDVWIPYGDPSDAELEKYNVTRKQWDNNEEVDDGWGGRAGVQECFYYDHYQSRAEAMIVDRIVEALNGWNLPL